MENDASMEVRKYRRLVFPYRGLVWGGIGFFIFLAARGTPLLFTCGVGLILAGEAFRIWGVGYIRNYRGPLEEVESLVTGGPYAYVRNPLYLANAVIGAGVALLSGWWWTLVLFTGMFILLYSRIVREEESYLAQRFPEAFREYSSHVTRFLPGLKPYAHPLGQFSWRVIPEKEIQTLVTLGIIILLFYLRSFTGLKVILDRVFF